MKRMAFIGPMADIADNTHSLLEPPSPAYSSVTVRRAFIVWMYCGQRNKFKDVCNYFHYLEALEDQLSPERRARSRHHEFNLFSNQPPTSEFMINNFPQLYKEPYIEQQYLPRVEEMRHEKCVFKLEGLKEIAPKMGTTTQEIVEASRMIKKYCQVQTISMQTFLEEFKRHASKCDLNYTVTNVAFYIKRKLVQTEIELEANYPKTLGFLNGGSVENDFDDVQVNTIPCKSVDDIVKSCSKNENVANNFKPIKILRKEDAKTVENTKENEDVTNTELDKTLGSSELEIAKDNLIEGDHKLIKDGSLTEDLADNIALKKERRFSGSQFMKIELQKFRKI